MNSPHLALLTIDMQNDVLRHIVPTGKAIVPAMRRALQACRASQIPVIHCLRLHRADGVDVEKFRVERFRNEPFLVRDTEGAQVIPELEVRSDEYLVGKARFSAFFQSDLQMILTRLGVSSLVICGVQTPNCVRCTVTDAIAYDYDVILLEDAIAAATPEVHKANLYDMEHMGAKIISVDSLVAILKGSDS